MKNKIISLQNVKGGSGKTTLTALLCQYLHENGIPVMAIDADIQRSLYNHRMRELKKNSKSEIPWQLEHLDTSDPEYVKAIIEKVKRIDACVIIDTPGNLNDQGLLPIFRSTDIAITPFLYDSDNLDATQMFAQTIKKVCKAKMFFVPNRISEIEERREEIQQARDNAKTILGKYGTLTARIKSSVVVKCYSTLQPLTYYQRNAVKYAFEPILNLIK